jgi:hypothetical protein
MIIHSKRLLICIFFITVVVSMSGCVTQRKPYDALDEMAKREVASRNDRDKRLNTWIGKSEKSLIAAWGTPTYVVDDKSVDTDGRMLDLGGGYGSYLVNLIKTGKKVIMYTVRGQLVLGGPQEQITNYQGAVGDTPYTGTSSAIVDRPHETSIINADTFFVVDGNGKVEQWKDARMFYRGAYYPPIKEGK